MKTFLKPLAAATSVYSVSLQAHEGHAALGTMMHEIQHAGWMAGALMLGSVMILLVFSASVKFADKLLSDKQMSERKRRD